MLEPVHVSPSEAVDALCSAAGRAVRGHGAANAEDDSTCPYDPARTSRARSSSTRSARPPTTTSHARQNRPARRAPPRRAREDHGSRRHARRAFGSGSSHKTNASSSTARPSSPAATSRSTSPRAIRKRTAQALRARYPRLDVRPLALDYAAPLPSLDGVLSSGGRRVVFFPGSSIGNFEPAGARRLLAEMAKVAGAEWARHRRGRRAERTRRSSSARTTTGRASRRGSTATSSSASTGSFTATST